ncbi:hypothetical protein SOCE26_018140 [Sorangium cellulosum]|uniref:Uncharacterized protein n=1 Tax=Sorangium cellulosum TaxID=56 RepID=A0A2L0EM84_SORCE|nr:hypothetical protein [Sorangium cellulosum]AUX40413.1 hypothetical protein SOCE26_018140 [Sorangium cellulosum]
MRPTKKRGAWLAAAMVLLALAAWLMSRGDREKPTVRPRKIEFPRHPKPAEQQRASRRRTLPPLPAPSPDVEAPQPRRDPVLVALPADPKRSAMVFEIEALKESPIMQIWLDCMLSRGEDRAGFARFKDRFGIDVLEDVERAATSSTGLVVLQGSFEGATFDRERWTTRTYGEKGIVYEEKDTGRVVATWGPDLLIAEPRAEPGLVEDAIDRLESTDPAQGSVLQQHQAYSDVYGVLSPDDLSNMLPSEQDQLAERIRETVERVEIHVDASEDVAVVAEVAGPAGQEMKDLSKLFGAALSLGRLNAKREGNDELAELLDYARVKTETQRRSGESKPEGQRFSVDVALPVELLKNLGPCRRDRSDPDRDVEAEPEPAPPG